MHCELRTETGKLFDKDKQMELSSWAWLIRYYLEVYAITLLQAKETFRHFLHLLQRDTYTGQQTQHLM